MKDEINSFENSVVAFETLGSDKSSVERSAVVNARVDLVESDIEEIVKLFRRLFPCS